VFATHSATAGWITVADQVQVGLGSTVLGHLRVAERSVIAPATLVSTDVE
jgi:acyl-[acyl carrier protein]--UDP-N-acetylglucosamine O-acyltransferase